MKTPATLFTLLALSTSAPAADAALRETITQTMARATAAMRAISTEGGYVHLYSPDLKLRTAERPAKDTQITMQPPGTPSMGLAFLRAYEATGDVIHLDAALAAASALAKCQLGSGGWHSTADFDPARPNEDGRLYDSAKFNHGQIIKHTIHTTFDDNTTQSCVRFLVTLAAQTRDSHESADQQIRQTLDRALDGMQRAQYPNGGWPQSYAGGTRDPADYPVIKASLPANYPRTWPDADYTGYYTLNDNCQSDCIETLLFAARTLNRPECLEAAKRGGDFLLLAQLPAPHRGWAQQYNFAMQPAWARSHEAPGVSSGESGGAVKSLLDLYLVTGELKYLEAAGEAVEWLRRCMIGKNHWSRLYELGTGKPIYGDDRGLIFYSVAELHAKSATGYVWESKYGIPEVLARYDRIQAQGRDAVVATLESARKEPPQPPASVEEITATLNESGYWLSPSRWRNGKPPEPSISTRTFIANMEALGRYLRQPQ